MHKNGLSYALKCTNNHVISSMSCMLSKCEIEVDVVRNVMIEKEKEKRVTRRGMHCKGYFLMCQKIVFHRGEREKM